MDAFIGLMLVHCIYYYVGCILQNHVSDLKKNVLKNMYASLKFGTE